MGTTWEPQKSKKSNSKRENKRNKTKPLGACFLSSLAAKYFYVYLSFSPFLASWANW